MFHSAVHVVSSLSLILFHVNTILPFPTCNYKRIFCYFMDCIYYLLEIFPQIPFFDYFLDRLHVNMHFRLKFSSVQYVMSAFITVISRSYVLTHLDDQHCLINPFHRALTDLLTLLKFNQRFSPNSGYLSERVFVQIILFCKNP